jgi:DNA-binding PadR family transcriptional regulator
MGAVIMSNQEVLVKTLKGMLDIIILKMLNDKPMHGYAFISIIRKRFGVYFGPSTIYPLLAGLAREGYVVCEWKTVGEYGRPIKVYTITERGRRFLEERERGLMIVVQPLISVRQQ